MIDINTSMMKIFRFSLWKQQIGNGFLDIERKACLVDFHCSINLKRSLSEMAQVVKDRKADQGVFFIIVLICLSSSIHQNVSLHSIGYS